MSCIFKRNSWKTLWSAVKSKFRTPQDDEGDGSNSDSSLRVNGGGDIVGGLIPSDINLVPYDSWEMVDVIYRGKFTSVHKVKYEDKFVAMKHIKLGHELKLSDIHNELTLLRDITRDGNDKFTHLYGAATDVFTVSIFMTYISGESTLGDVIEDLQVDYTDRIRLAIQLCQASDYLHNKLGIVHNDIKPHNILVDGDKLMLCDFGYSGCIGSTDNVGNGTMQYMAPEAVLMKCETLQPSLDVWSIAATVIEMFIDDLPWPEIDDDDDIEVEIEYLLKKYHNVHPSGLNQIGGYTLVEILQSCFYAPDMRAGLGEIIPKFEKLILEYEDEID
ncbi:uncharacterized protein LOC144445312 [Glandiceps talaboti]